MDNLDNDNKYNVKDFIISFTYILIFLIIF